MDSIELIRYSDILKEAFFDLFYYKLYSDGYVPIDNTINIDKTSLINNKLVDSKIKSILKKSQNELNNLEDIEFTQLLKKIIADTEKLNGESQLALVKVFQLVKGKKFVEFLKILLVDLRTEFGRLFSIKNSIDNESPLNWKFEDFQFDYKNGYLQRSNVQLNFINNFDDFIAALKKIKPSENSSNNFNNSEWIEKVFYGKKLFYRGHSNVNYLLKPGVARNINLHKNEHHLYEQTILRNPDYFKDDKYHIDKLKTMQHYGVPTRLLDITSNPLIALYFSVCDSNNVDGEVIVFDVNESEIKYTESDSISILASMALLDYPTKTYLYVGSFNNKQFSNSSEINKLVSKIRLEKPSFQNTINSNIFEENFFVLTKKDNRRIQKQDGAFICCSCNPYTAKSINQYRFSIHNKRQILIISKNAKKDILNQLELFDIHRGSIYPEIDKVSEYLVKKYS
ncbi:FRG domain-containing protein [Streptococcus suis]|uniref:FRG domain-containing protein n=1 Tax=Streptococcus suis TaxID=1307 RepID=A0A4T2GQI3_STRSU|nr:FRG domain-containing protein [Streptococcus suis]MBY4966652.1 FRG domain-containing protein [Streptococcus suis]TII01388.1 FRG domain-containing protein [Streptococcus suis]HEM2779517.1 FRG domain-containing protein [Streptococcus suis]